MASLEEIARALKNADAAGDTAAAQKLAQAYQQEKARQQPMAGRRGSEVKKLSISREEALSPNGVKFDGTPLTPEESDRIAAALPERTPQANRMYDTLDRKGVMFGSVALVPPGPVKVPASGSLLGKGPRNLTRSDFMTPADIDAPMDVKVPEKMSRAQSVALGINDFNPIRLATGDLGYDAALTQSLKDNPISTRIGQTTALTSGGGAQLTGRALLAAPRLVAPSVAARLVGDQLWKRGVRMFGRGVALAGVGTADFYGYNALAEAPNIAREAGAPPPSIGERIDYANSQIASPYGWAPLPGMMIAGRTLRGALAGGKNLATTGTLRKAVPQAGAKPQITGTYADLFTPADVQRRVAGFSGQLTTMSRTDAEKAIDMLLKRGFDPDEAEKMVKFLDYAGKSEVPEMLFQIMPDLRRVDQLTVALGTVGGDAQQALATALGQQAQEAPGVLRNALRKAMGISGEDYYAMQKGLKAEQLSGPKAGYEAAYGREVSDATWEGQILPVLQSSPSARSAIREAAAYAADTNELAVSRQLTELADALDSGAARPPKVSTQSLDYIDRMLGDMAQGIRRGSGRQELARGPVSAQQRIRGNADSGLDAETGLGDPRRLSAELKTAQEALEFGRKAFRAGTDLETLQDEFALAIQKLGQDGADSETIRGALLMGWLRGAEDDIATATNPQATIRRLYGSERQRQKLLEMMPRLPDETTAGIKGSNTKDIRALVGGKREDGREMAGMIDRLRRLSGDYNRIIGNSQTAQRLEAVAEQGGNVDRLNQLFDVLEAPKVAAKRVARATINHLARPGIYRPGVNRELGRLLTARGKKQLLAVIDEIRQRQIATGKGPRAPGGAPVPPSTPIRAGGFAGFGGKRSQPISNEQLAQEMDRLAPRFDLALKTFTNTKAADVPGAQEALMQTIAKAKQVGRGATDDQIIEEAYQLTRRRMRHGPDWPPPRDSLQPVGADEYMPDLSRMVSNKRFFEVDLDTAIRESLTDLDDILAMRGMRRGDDMIPLDKLKAQLEDPRLRGADMTRPNGLAAGLKSDLGGAVGGALFSGAMPMEEDATLQDRLTRAGVGALLGAGGMRASRMLARQGADDLARTAGAGRAPKSGAEWGKVKQHNGQSVESATFGPENRGLELTISKDGEVAFTLYRQSVRPGDPSVEGAQELRQSLGKVIMALREHAQSVRAKPYYTVKPNEPKKADIYRKLLARETGDGLQFYETPDGTFVVTKKSKFEVEKRFGPVRAAAQATSPQQAAKYETPGSPEWEAAKAKGLDMSQAGRMARAKEMGFDKDVYHATDADITEFDSAVQELGTHVGGKRAANDRAVDMGSKSIMPLKIRGKYVGVPDMRDFSDPFLYLAKRGNIDERFNAPAVFLKDLDREAKRIADGGLNGQMWNETNRAASKKPWGEAVREVAKRHNIDGFRYMNRHEGKGSLSYVVFDPSNIRSVNAAFDPDKAASPILTAGFGNFDITAPGQQIAKGLRAIDRRVRSARDPRIVGPLVKDVPQRGSNVPAIEQMPDRNKALSVLSDAIYAARSAERLGGQRGALGRGIKNKIGDYARSVKDRRAASEVVSLPARRARDTWAKAQQDYQDAWARYMSLRDARAPQSDLETAAKEVARLDALRQTLKAKIPVQALPPDPAMSELVRRAARIADSGMRNYRPLRPSRRLLEMYDEAVDLLTNPRRLADARMASQAKPLGSHEKAGQAIAGVGAVGGGGYLAYRQYEKDRR